MDLFFQHIKRYIDVSQADEIAIAAKLKHMKYLKGQYILQAGEICRYHTYIVSGNVRTYYLAENGNEHIVTFGIEDWWTGDLGSFISQKPADFTIQCLENTEVIQISYDSLQQLFIDVPKIERFFRRIIQNAYVNAQKRIVQNYSMTALERYLQFCQNYPQIEQRVPQYMVASFLGITKEFLSHIRSQLAK